jgi:hypothetical protein
VGLTGSPSALTVRASQTGFSGFGRERWSRSGSMYSHTSPALAICLTTNIQSSQLLCPCRMMLEVTVFFDMLKKNDVCMYMIDKADYSGLITVSSWEQKAKCVVRCIV